jgi:Na+/H+ antiporter 1
LQQGAWQKALTISGGNLGGNQCDVEVTVKGDVIVMTVLGTTFSVTYRKSPDSPLLVASDIRDDLNSAIGRFTFRARAWTAANEKARSWAGSCEHKESPGEVSAPRLSHSSADVATECRLLQHNSTKCHAFHCDICHNSGRLMQAFCSPLSLCAAWPRRALPLLAALGGMLVPALIFLAVNWHSPATWRGWAIPTATDIAFALGVLSLFGSTHSVPMLWRACRWHHASPVDQRPVGKH